MKKHSSQAFDKYLTNHIDAETTHYIVFNIDINNEEESFQHIFGSWFINDMPCCYLFPYVEKFLKRMEVKYKSLKLAYTYFDEKSDTGKEENNNYEEEEEKEIQIEILESDQTLLKELAKHHIMDINVVDSDI